MNILAVEQRFKQVDKKERKIRVFYDPKSRNGRKHQFIADIRNDFLYDQTMYGHAVCNFNEGYEDVEAEPYKSMSVLTEKPVEKAPEKSGTATEGNRSRLRQSGVRSYLKQPEKDGYKGIFSDTTINKPQQIQRFQDLRPQPTKLTFKGGEDIPSGTTKNKAAADQIHFSKDPTPTLTDHELLQQRVQNSSLMGRSKSPALYNRSQSLRPATIEPKTCYINKQILPTKMRQQQSKTFDNPRPSQDIRVIGAKQEENFVEKNPDFYKISIKYESEGIYDVLITDIDANGSHKCKIERLIANNEGWIQFSNNQSQLNLLDAFPWAEGKPEKLYKHIVRIQAFIANDWVVDKFVFFGHIINERSIRNEIFRYFEAEREDYDDRELTILSQTQHKDYNDLLKIQENRAKSIEPSLTPVPNLKLRAVTPSLLRLTSSGSRRFKKDAIKLGGGFNLPKVRPSFELKSKVTNSLVRYRDKYTGFYPISYGANLSAYKEHDFIEERYKNNTHTPSEMVAKTKQKYDLGVTGQSMI